MCTFIVRPIIAFLHLGTLHTLPHKLTGCFTITNQSTNNVKFMALNRWKRTLITSDHGLHQARQQSWEQPHCYTFPAPASPAPQYPEPRPLALRLLLLHLLLTRANERKGGRTRKETQVRIWVMTTEVCLILRQGLPPSLDLIISSLALDTQKWEVMYFVQGHLW